MGKSLHCGLLSAALELFIEGHGIYQDVVVDQSGFMLPVLITLPHSILLQRMKLGRSALTRYNHRTILS